MAKLSQRKVWVQAKRLRIEFELQPYKCTTYGLQSGELVKTNEYELPRG